MSLAERLVTDSNILSYNPRYDLGRADDFGTSASEDQSRAQRMRSIFQESWWLSAAGGSALERTDVMWDGRAVASLFYVRRRSAGFTLLEMPPYTRTSSIELRLPAAKAAKRLRNTHAAVADLIAVLPAHDRLQLTLEPADPLAFSLALAGCSLGQQFTFTMPSHVDIDAHWTLLDPKTRNLIRSADQALSVQVESSIEPLLILSEERHGAANRAEADTLERIALAAAARNCILTMTARTEDGKVSAVAVLVWDQKTLFFWQSCRSPHVFHSGATSLLVWQGMLEAKRRGLSFDIDGYHSLEAARFVSRFGLTPQSRTSVLHLSRRAQILQAVGRVFGRGKGFGVQPIYSNPFG